MNDTAANPILEVTRIFAASPSKVFDAWMNREQWQAWIGPEGMMCEVPLMEPFEGGNFQIKMKISEDNIIPVVGVFREIEKSHRIVFTWGRAGDALSQSVITVMLNAINERTELTLQHTGLSSIESRNDHERGWNGTFNKLERHLAAPYKT